MIPMTTLTEASVASATPPRTSIMTFPISISVPVASAGDTERRVMKIVRGVVGQ